MQRLAVLGLVGFVAFLVVGNLLILGASAWARAVSPESEVEGVEGVPKLQRVDARVWRGAAPEEPGYRSLAENGVRTVVDLRAEHDIEVDEARLRALGLRYVHLPVRDGQIPNPEEVGRLFDVVAETDGVTFVHCGAGVGRTGSMVAAYLVRTGQASGAEALWRNLAVGPPSLEQLAFTAELAEGELDRPNPALIAASRVLDAPRRLWSRYGF